MTATPTATPTTPGSIVRARGREWVVLPNPPPNTLKLRPLGGGDQQIATLFLPLEGHDVAPATFPWPDASQSGSQSSALLMRDALLLKLRAGAGPFRSLGNLIAGAAGLPAGAAADGAQAAGDAAADRR
jgi:hypothetical protein